jgi:hypothetical protein
VLLIRDIATDNVQNYDSYTVRPTPENVGLQKEQKYNTFACNTCNEVRLCFGNSQKGSWQHEKIR